MQNEIFYGYSDRCSKELKGIHNVAAFICNEGAYSDVSITNKNGVVLVTTFGPFLNKVINMDFRNELLLKLLPMQTGQAPTDYIEVSDKEELSIE